MEAVGFIGLGIMGKPMALNLLKNGYKLVVYDINPIASEEFAVNAGVCVSDPVDIGNSCGIVFTILPNGATVREVLFGDGGVASGLKEGSIVVDMSSVTPEESISFANELNTRRVNFLDAPVSGGESKAIDGTLVFLVGGDDNAYERILPLFKVMGSSSILVGKTGSGSTAKLVNQVIVNLTIAAISEGFVLATKAGLDPAKVYEAIRGGVAGSAVLDIKAPMMLDRNFRPGGKLSINHKDISNVMQTAQAMDVPMPMSSQLFEIMQTLKIKGFMESDNSVIVKYFEMLSNVEVKRF